jgi:hypothetical protein
MNIRYVLITGFQDVSITEEGRSGLGIIRPSFPSWLLIAFAVLRT